MVWLVFLTVLAIHVFGLAILIAQLLPKCRPSVRLIEHQGQTDNLPNHYFTMIKYGNLSRVNWKLEGF